MRRRLKNIVEMNVLYIIVYTRHPVFWIIRQTGSWRHQQLIYESDVAEG